MADVFQQWQSGTNAWMVDTHHRVGYNVLYFGGHVRWYADPNRSITTLNPGADASDMFGVGADAWDAFTE